MKAARVVAIFGILALAAGVWVVCNAGESSPRAALGVAALETPESGSVFDPVDTPAGQERVARFRAHLEESGASDAEIEEEVAQYEERMRAFFNRSAAEIEAEGVARTRAGIVAAREVGDSVQADTVETQLDRMIEHSKKEGVTR